MLSNLICRPRSEEMSKSFFLNVCRQFISAGLWQEERVSHPVQSKQIYSSNVREM
uniref:Uncharacterized protein n=1 Tax=Anguilla anguilla TaxID=7936 RepID=A0A0E9U0B4_ANGAN